MLDAENGVDLATRLDFVAAGTSLCAHAIDAFTAAEFEAPCGLPGWSRKHLVAHLAANAEAIGRLLHWARTGQPTPMYASPEQRAADIEAGARLSGSELSGWFERSAGDLATAMAALTAAQWGTEVVTAQGRVVTAAETPWMRARELLVHAVDLDAGITFARLPAGFLTALHDEILAKRSAEGLPALSGDVADVTAYLAGRTPLGPVTTPDGSPAPALTPWL